MKERIKMVLNNWKKLIMCLLCLFIIATPHLSVAAGNDPAGGNPGGGGQPGGSATKDSNDIVKILCNVIDFITGGIGKAIAIIILISLAISLFIGKVSWGLAIAVAVGMGILFGAKTIMNAVTKGVGDDSGTEICKP